MMKRAKKAVTLIELMIVAALSCFIMGVGMAMMNRSNIQFKKSNDMVSIQRLMDNIVERIRSDVRSLKRVISYDKSRIEFVIYKVPSNSDEDDNNTAYEETITYHFDSEEKTLYRKVGGSDGESDFHGAKQILSLVFSPSFKNGLEDDNSESATEDELKNKEFSHLDVAIQIAANEYSGKKKDTSTLSIACQFYSTCVESETVSIQNLRKLR